MPLRLIGTIILLLVVTIFAGANLDNRCDINFIFTKVQQVPVFLTAIVSFLIGAIIMIPFTFKRKCNNDKKSQNPAPTKVQKSSDEQKTLFDFKIKRDVSKNQGKEKKEKKSWFEKNKKSEETKTSAESKASTAKDSEKSEKSETPKSSESEKSSSNQNSGTEKTKETTSV